MPADRQPAAAAQPEATAGSPAVVDVSVIVPVRNAAHFLEECLTSIGASHPREIIVVDGNSTDDSVEIARRHTEHVLSDEGRGLPVARMLGARAATSRWVALIDADVVLPPGAIGKLLDEVTEGGYTALQAGLSSVSGQGYWGRGLAHQHRSGRSRYWFGLVATVMERSTLMDLGFDERFPSGEDIDLRWRLRQGSAHIGVSRRVVVQHRFDDTFEAARDQWTMDGRGLARMVLTHKLHALPLVLLPLAGFVWGAASSLMRLRPQWIPYFVGYLVFNYQAMAAELLAGVARSRRVRA